MGKSISNNYVETILNNDSLTKDEKVKMINFVYENYRQKLDEDLRNYLIKIWAGAFWKLEVQPCLIQELARLALWQDKNCFKKR